MSDKKSSEKKASAEGNADVLEGFKEESGNEIDDDDSSDKEIPFSLGGTEEHGEVPGRVHFFIGRPPDEKMDPPGNFTMFFSPTQGEGDLFVGGIIVIYFISRFFLESFQNIRVTFG